MHDHHAKNDGETPKQAAMQPEAGREGAADLDLGSGVVSGEQASSAGSTARGGSALSNPVDPLGASAGKAAQVAMYRPVLQAVARMIATDRRAVVLATEKAEVLLANGPAARAGLGNEAFGTVLTAAGLDWAELCGRAQRAGNVRINLVLAGAELEGELVHLPLGQAEGFLLRLSESDQEAIWLRNRARAANLMRVAHDMRTPIQALLVTAERILDGQEGRAKNPVNTGEITPSPSILRQQLKRAAGLALDQISNVLGVIRGEQSVSGLRPDEDFSLTTELRGLQAMIAPIAQARGARVVLTLSPQTDIWVHGPVRFVRALCQNMVDNSVKYGGDLIEINVKCQSLAPTIEGVSQAGEEMDRPSDGAADRAGHRVQRGPAFAITIEVCDQGGGLPQAQKERLRAALGKAAVIAPADPSLEADTQPAAAQSAGLDVLAHALRQLGGRLELRDRGAQGAELGAQQIAGEPIAGTIMRATFTLLQGTPQNRATPTETTQFRAPKDAPSLAGIGVLVVEDSPASRDWLVHMLRAAGAQVQAAENGVEALEMLRSPKAMRGITLMLSDMTLPFISGVELARRIRAEQAAGTITWRGELVALTAHSDPTIDAACYAAGIAKVLEKPIVPAQLCREIFDVVDRVKQPRGTAGDEIAARKAVQADGDLRKAAPPLGAQGQKAETARGGKITKRGAARGASAKETVKARAKTTSAPARTAAFAPLVASVVEDLVEQLGTSGAKRFMHRARTEAQSVLNDIRRDGITSDTGRMIHAATGACGLTGLKRVERGLRTLETALPDRSLNLNTLLSELETAITEAEQVIEEITS